MGPYTISVFAEYWNAVHKPEDEKGRTATRSGLGSGYDDKPKAKETYGDAMGYLDVQTRQQVPKTKESEPVGDREKIIARYRKLDKAERQNKACRPADQQPPRHRQNEFCHSYWPNVMGENDLKNSANSPKTFRMLSLLAINNWARASMTFMPRQVTLWQWGRKVFFTITKSDGTVREAVDIRSSKK